MGARELEARSSSEVVIKLGGLLGGWLLSMPGLTFPCDPYQILLTLRLVITRRTTVTT